MSDADVRLMELQSHWRKAQSAAQAIGYIKPDGMSWDDAAVEIVKLEQAQLAEKPESLDELLADAPVDVPVETPETPEPIAEYQPQGIYPTRWYQANNIPVCSLCGEQYLSDSNGPICAESFPESVCPRLSGVSNE